MTPFLQIGSRVAITTECFIGLAGRQGTVVKYNHNTYSQFRTVDVRPDGWSDKAGPVRFDLTDIKLVGA